MGYVHHESPGSSLKIASVDRNTGKVAVKGSRTVAITVKVGSCTVKVTVKVKLKKQSVTSKMCPSQFVPSRN